MNCQLSEIESSNASSNKGRVLGVIVLTDNRMKKTEDKPNTYDYRNSAFKGITGKM